MKPSIEEIEFHGIAALRLNGPRGASAVVSKLGAQVLSWVTPDGRERLFLSDKAVFDGSVAIRGGIPVCWPQFAGLGRRCPSTASSAPCPGRSAPSVAVTTTPCSPLNWHDDATTRALWPHAFRLELTVMLETDRLDLELSVNNTGDSAFAFTGALHSYLRVVQVEDVTLEGLYGHDYRDAAKGNVVVPRYRHPHRRRGRDGSRLSPGQAAATAAGWQPESGHPRPGLSRCRGLESVGSANAPRWPTCRPMAGGTCCASRRWPSSR